MDFLLLALVVGIAIHQIVLHRRTSKAIQKLQVAVVSMHPRAGQGRMRKGIRGSTEPPALIDRARTTRRDTSDIEATGRMGPLKPTSGGESVARQHYDGELPPST